ncbi:ribosome silencing factor [Microbacterium dextranolyticum]|uniref:Ribosomal silencing factor RsfS n=1 Tax=Microbacterium dextranolyticum TaxID=36806 RepID=A0A9W6M6Z7_9MICO|nr:ribosome silencing factor [Microbacterium dextranolyticum]MBM7462876.1 ribosome-associated protein [Microbacterium dextranolyticum]GLJ96018.1 ribosomal silencing factor RsfS [Microbacterium dextranolyticum]
MTATTRTRELLEIAAAAADGKGAEDLVAFDVSEPLPLVDAFLLATGNSERNVAAIADAVEEAMLEEGVNRLRREGKSEARWILIDFGDVVVHVFHEEERAFYGLERLWKDCPVLPVGVTADAPE